MNRSIGNAGNGARAHANVHALFTDMLFTFVLVAAVVTALAAGAASLNGF